MGMFHVPSKKYHRQQAELLAKLAASTSDEATADNLRLLVLEHLERAERREASGPADGPAPSN
jgi:hypothetical protein